MEKKKAHYDLKAIQELVRNRGIGAFTATAKEGFLNMNLTDEEALAVILSLKNDMLYKSMTTHMDSRVWQDVYHASCPNGKTAYIKLTLRDGAVVIQFKEKG
jgi:motility quorum-sensing regulator/GCU-specific mRNA interferase toxin